MPMWYFHLGRNALYGFKLHFLFLKIHVLKNTVFIPIVAIAPIGVHPSTFCNSILSHEGLDLYLWSFFNWSLEKNIEMNKCLPLMTYKHSGH